MCGGRALNQCIERLAGVGTLESATEPRVIRILAAAVGLLARTRSGALAPGGGWIGWNPRLPVPAIAAVQNGDAVALRLLLSDLGQRFRERQCAVVLIVNVLRSALIDTESRGQCTHTHAVDVAEIDRLGGAA